MYFKLKEFVKTRLPFVGCIVGAIRNPVFFLKSPEGRFAAIYKNNTWGDALSRSGSGSNLTETEVVRAMLPVIIEELKCQSILDIPCGDFFWMKLVEVDIHYTGGDIVTDMVRRNHDLYGDTKRKFVKMNIVDGSLAKADLVLCRDCLVHLSFKDIFQALRNVKNSGSVYFLTTTFTGLERNANIITGDWRPINLQKAPFSFPQPMKIINEKCPSEGFSDKSLGLWRVADIPDYEKL